MTYCTQQLAAMTHGANGGDEHGVNDSNKNREDDPNPHAEPRLILVGKAFFLVLFLLLDTPFFCLQLFFSFFYA